MDKVTLKKISRVDDRLLKEVVSRIVNAVDPQRIILFGSCAHGAPGKDSDIDLLVVMDSPLARYKRSVPVYEALSGLLIPKDVLVYTRREIEEWSDVPQAFITTVVRNGKVIYEKE